MKGGATPSLVLKGADKGASGPQKAAGPSTEMGQQMVMLAAQRSLNGSARVQDAFYHKALSQALTTRPQRLHPALGEGYSQPIGGGAPRRLPFLLHSPVTLGGVASTICPFTGTPLSAAGIGRSLHAHTFLGPCCCGWIQNAPPVPPGRGALALSFLPLPSPRGTSCQGLG